jgi:uncharacterized membrane protein
MLDRWVEKLSVFETEKAAARLSRELRRGGGEHLRRRRGVVALSLVSMSSMAVVVLYQMGMIRRIPEPPLPGLDAERVDGSPEAYGILGMPDGALGMVSYAATLMLAAAGGKNRARTAPWLPLALAGKAAVDATQAARLTRDQWVDHRAFCSWCLLAAGATFAALPATLPEAREALRHLRRPG